MGWSVIVVNQERHEDMLQRHGERLSEGARTFAEHSARIDSLENYKAVQNGALLRAVGQMERMEAKLDTKIDSFCTDIRMEMRRIEDASIKRDLDARDRESAREKAALARESESRAREEENRKWNQGWLIKLGIGFVLAVVGAIISYGIG